MACYSPVPYKVGNYNNVTGKFKPIVLPRTEFNLNSTSLRFPCGKCKGCRIDSSRQKAIRIEHEVQTQAEAGRGSCFITLTYATKHLPPGGSLVQSHYSDFMKRLRRRITNPADRFFVSKDLRIKCVYCGEYGEKLGRPHFHAIIFGYDFPDRKFWEMRKGNNPLFRSAFLEELWPFGHSSIGSATFQSGAYVARYIMKKVSGDAAEEHYRVVDPDTGEVFHKKPEFNQVGNGIGLDWFNKYGRTDVYPRGEVVTKAGKKMKPPRYYDTKYELIDPVDMERIKEERKALAALKKADNTEDRLKVKAKVLDARLKLLKRDL